MKDSEGIEQFKQKLDEQHNWPCLYMFKFIVPANKESEVHQLLSPHPLESKASTGGKYISLTAKVMMSSSEEVMKIYAEVNQIEGLIAL